MYQAAPPPPPAFAPPSGGGGWASATPPSPRPRRSVPVLVPHLIWDAVLLLLVVAVCTAALIWTPVFEGPGIWGTLAINGLIASGLALSMRTGTPNLAVAGLAALSGAVYAELLTGADLPWALAAAVAMIAVLVFGALLGLIAGLTSAPAWAVSLGGLALAQAVVFGVTGLDPTAVSDELPLGGDAWFVTFVLLSLAGGGLFAVSAVRRLLSANRGGGDRVRFTGGRLVGALAGFVGSSALAGLAGLAMVSHYRVFDLNFGGDFSLLVGLAAVLLGGVSAFGGRGGVAGTVFGTVLVVVAISWLTYEDLLDLWGRFVVVGLAILIGVAVSRVMEAIAPVEPPGAALAPAGSPGVPGGPSGVPGGPPVAPGGAPPHAPGAAAFAPTAPPGPAGPPEQAGSPEQSVSPPAVQDTPPPAPAGPAGPASAPPAPATEPATAPLPPEPATEPLAPEPATEPLAPETGADGEPHSGSSSNHPERS